ncbi:MAG: hypothetical protein ACI8W7_002302 [Gammaproteobacteria bacterium]|jgi:hypothetical protein
MLLGLDLTADQRRWWGAQKRPNRAAYFATLLRAPVNVKSSTMGGCCIHVHINKPFGGLGDFD